MRWLASLRSLAFLPAGLLLSVTPAAAHPVPFSYLDVRLEASGIRGVLTVHTFDVAHDPSVEFVKTRLAITVDGRPAEIVWGAVEAVPEKESLRLPFGVKLGSDHLLSAGVVSMAGILFPYDPSHQTFVNVYERNTLRQQAILDVHRSSIEYFSGSIQGRAAVVRRFVGEGIHHILIGPDHLLFLVGLLLLGGSIRRLAMVVTSFTVAHSITLTVAALGLFTPPGRVVEPLIAVSIIYVGVDNLLVKGGRDVRGWIAFAFGLIHGFGFASVLREMGLPAAALGWSLFSFNLGVEIGQLIVVAAVASALAVLARRSVTSARRLAFAGSLVVVLAGTFWFVQRVLFV